MLDPEPGNDGKNNKRHSKADERRLNARKIAVERVPLVTKNNEDIENFGYEWPTSFHKGIPHSQYGLPDPLAFKEFQKKLSNKGVKPGDYATFDVALGPSGATGMNKGKRGPKFDAVKKFHSVIKKDGEDKPPNVRNWESPLAGHTYDLEGPDMGDVGMAKAPPLGDDELVAEMAEVYALALLRDVPFTQWDDPTTPITVNDESLGGDTGPHGKPVKAMVGTILDELNALSYFKGFKNKPSTPKGRRRWARTEFYGAPSQAGRPKNAGQRKTIALDTMFRGSAPGAKDGPYLSQFMLIGSSGKGSGSAKDVRNNCTPEGMRNGPEDGYITYGAQRIDQRISAAKPGLDYMTDWTLWLDVQNGAMVNGADKFDEGGKPRFLSTPRDLATYVHFDQLYQAYLNACLLMLEYGVPFDYGMPSGKGHLTRGSFATFGGPHILALMTEVSSRALKAVRRQKFQHHLRGRPEQLAAMITLAGCEPGQVRNSGYFLEQIHDALTENAPNIMGMIVKRNKLQNDARENTPHMYPRIGKHGPVDFAPHPDKNYMLPMAFPEGSPMHASYGAGHATVAGACVTMLKAFFEMSPFDVKMGEATTDHPLPPAKVAYEGEWWDEATIEKRLGFKKALVPPSKRGGKTLKESDFKTSKLTLVGELNKLAANISIGRNMAGVHFYADYYDSLRMGERIAVGILQEQMTNYNDPCSLRLPTFDGDRLIISTDGKGKKGKVRVLGGSADKWWKRHVPQSNIG